MTLLEIAQQVLLALACVVAWEWCNVLSVRLGHGRLLGPDPEGGVR